ncbi:MAG: hypothetical protein KC445_01750 [Anaerolineales bacterium]|nr:hypothetical protein [Anaerolineales bacterium]
MSKQNDFSDLNDEQRLLLLFHQLHQHTTTEREKERQYLAKKLNDEAIQSLLALHIQLSAQLSQHPMPQRVEYAESLTIIANLADELKVIARGLRPLEVDTLDLVDTLEQAAALFSEQTNIPVTFATMSIPDMPNHVILLLYQLLQAALDNVAQHAYAGQVWVNLWATEQEVVLKVEDDGQGLASVGRITEPAQAPGLTLFDLMLRFRQAGGHLTLQSHPDEGTKVTAVFPLN